MSTLVEAFKPTNKLWAFGASAVLLLFLAVMFLPTHNLSRQDAYFLHQEQASRSAHDAVMQARQQASLSASLENASPAPPPTPAGDLNSTADRKIVRTIALQMTVTNPVESAAKIQAFAVDLGGYVESSQINTQGTPGANLTIRVPAAKLDEATAGLRKMAVRVDSERTDAQDVTKQYVDMGARLRNLRAEEAQYLTIMKSSVKVQDMLDVSEKLSGVRGEIEQQQAEFAALSKQVETVAITIALRAQVDTEILGFHWRPLYQLKVAAHDALDGLASYVSTVTAVVLYLPVILLWAVTILVGVLGCWRVFRWAGHAFFGWKSSVQPLSEGL